MARPAWGLIDIIVVYLAITGTAVVAVMYPPLTGLSEIQFFIYLFAVQFFATVFFVCLFAVFLRKGKLGDLGLRTATFSTYWHYGIKGGFLLVIMVLLMGLVLQYFQPQMEMQEIEEVLRSATYWPDILAIVLAGTIMAPIGEELFYRGMIYPVFRKHLGPVWGAITAGLIFGLAHMDLWRAIPLAIGGAALCYLYEKSGTIFAPMLAHAVWNGTMFALVFLNF